MTACVFAPSPLLTVTVEQGHGGTSEVHLHAGGQGFWIARMLVALGVPAQLCAPLGGEAGAVLETLIAAEGVGVRVGTRTRGNGAYVHDRREGERETVADMPPTVLSRHEVDELYGSTLAAGLAADVTVLGGTSAPDVLPVDVYRRIAADLRAVGRPVVADLSGETLTAALQGGVTLLKVSHEDLLEDGRADGEDVDSLTRAMRTLAKEGADNVVVSRADEPTIACLDGELLEVRAPRMQRVDHRGAGDSMTAGLAAGLARGASTTEALRLGAAAGTSNVTRRGLATGQREVVEQLAEHIVVRPMRTPRS
jgi:1-phosphofructokinase